MGRGTWRDWAVAAAAVTLATAAGFAMVRFFELTNIVMVYLLATLAVAGRGRRGPAVLSAALSVLCFDFCFVPPRYTFSVADSQYVVTFLVMFATAMVISHLTTRIRAQTEEARLGEERASALHALSSRLAGARDLTAALEAAARHVAGTFGGRVALLMPGEGPGLEERAASAPGPAADEKGMSVARWVFDAGEPAGLGTQTLADADALYVPLLGAAGPVGVLRLEPAAGERTRLAGQVRTVEAFAREVGLRVEVERLGESAERARLEAETERLRSALLSSVSHDLRTPLAGIIGSASGLLQSGAAPGGARGRELLENIQTEGERLARLVDNILEATRLESGEVRLRKEPAPLEEPLGAALERADKALAGREVTTVLPEDLPMAPVDAVLLEQVFVNLLENAARHTPAGTPVTVSARVEGGELAVEVADRGPGVAPGETRRVFEKFYHGRSAGAGAGLGLAICRAIVEAHGGSILAEDRPGGGAVFRFTLPLGGAA
ncbi:MAG: DUF4118 domain-containing protein [Elusimicrobia bacterium]|nr:DUF4118 domain-containing protein [Elusimicrobiota bacterium]